MHYSNKGMFSTISKDCVDDLWGLHIERNKETIKTATTATAKKPASLSSATAGFLILTSFTNSLLTIRLTSY